MGQLADPTPFMPDPYEPAQAKLAQRNGTPTPSAKVFAIQKDPYDQILARIGEQAKQAGVSPDEIRWSTTIAQGYIPTDMPGLEAPKLGQVILEIIRPKFRRRTRQYVIHQI
jgi:hypothetical protein